MPSRWQAVTLTLEPVAADDADSLAALRVQAMRESLERIGRFDPERARARFLDTFSPEFTRAIVEGGQRVGFVVVRPHAEGLLLDHLYVHPSHQSRGIGAAVLQLVFAEADASNATLRVGALRGSRSNEFYLAHGFKLVEQAEFDNYYVRMPQSAVPGPWTETQFAEMSWHDNHVHAMRIIEGEHGAGELVLDIDYILEWLKEPQGFKFKMVPATLRFHGVTGLRVTLDYAASSAAIVPFSIHIIERREEVRERYTAQCWNIVVNWPKGELSFEADGFTQVAWGKVRTSSEQHLLATERETA